MPRTSDHVGQNLKNDPWDENMIQGYINGTKISPGDVQRMFTFGATTKSNGRISTVKK